jgi:hypothetical protein
VGDAPPGITLLNPCHASGQAIRGLYQYHQEGIGTRGVPSHNVAVTMTKTSTGTPEAKVTDCSDSAGSGTYYSPVVAPQKTPCGACQRVRARSVS